MLSGVNKLNSEAIKAVEAEFRSCRSALSASHSGCMTMRIIITCKHVQYANRTKLTVKVRATVSDPLSPVASKRRRTQFTSTGPSRFARPGRTSDPRQPPSGWPHPVVLSSLALIRLACDMSIALLHACKLGTAMDVQEASV